MNKDLLPIENIISEVRQRVRVDLEHPIVIQPSQNTNVQAVVDVLNMLKDFAGSNISIAKQEEGGQ